MKKVIFICSGNTCRSPMAEGLFKKMCADAGVEIEVSSAGVGTFAGMPPSYEAVEAAKAYDVDISAHRSRCFHPLMAGEDTLFVCMTYSHAAVLLSAGVKEENIRVLDIVDPYGGDAEVYRACAAALAQKLTGILEEVR